jgi:5-methylcytosine-specific restriction endonuclease McrBC regulatory subunit McrC
LRPRCYGSLDCIYGIGVRIALGEFETLLETVAAEEFLPWRVPLVTYSRLNRHYRPTVELARLILQGFSLEFRTGNRTGAAFLVDMAPVFERFLAVALRDRQLLMGILAQASSDVRWVGL